MEIRTFPWQIPFEKSIQMADFPLKNKILKNYQGPIFLSTQAPNPWREENIFSCLRTAKKTLISPHMGPDPPPTTQAGSGIIQDLGKIGERIIWARHRHGIFGILVLRKYDF